MVTQISTPDFHAIKKRVVSDRAMLYLIGPPGAGKTAILREALADVPYQAVTWPFALRKYPGGWVLGDDRTPYGGTDTLARNVRDLCLAWLRSLGSGARVIGEGERLSDSKFFTAVRSIGYRLDVLSVITPEAEARRRSAVRDQSAGTGKWTKLRRTESAQSDAWLRGRFTKYANLTEEWCDAQSRLDGCLPLEYLGLSLRNHPIVRDLRGE